MGARAKIKIVLALIVILGVAIGISMGLDWKCYEITVVALMVLSGLVSRFFAMLEESDNTTFIICDRDEYNTIDEDDLDVREWAHTEGGQENMRTMGGYLAEQLQNEEFGAAYDEWEPDFKIADALLSFRAANKLTQEELAKLIGMNRGRLSELETASGNPTLKTLKKIAMALGAKLEIEFGPVAREGMVMRYYAIKNIVTGEFVTGFESFDNYVGIELHSTDIIAKHTDDSPCLYRSDGAAREALGLVQDDEKYTVIPLRMVED